MTSHKTSAKAPKDPPKRIRFPCPVCSRLISLQPAEYAYRIKTSSSPITCSGECRHALRRQRMAAGVATA